MAAPLRPRRALSRPHRGQTIVLFALGSLMLMAMLGLAIDAGYQYAERRAMQNAADAAAQAGAKALHLKESGSAIEQAALQAAQQNGFTGDPSTFFQCYFIYKDYQTTAAVSGTTCGATTVNDSSTFAGVQIRIKELHQTFVMRAIGITETGTAAVSTAQVQLLATVDMADAPFLVCGYQAKTEGGNRYDLLSGYSGLPFTQNYQDNVRSGSVSGTVGLTSDAFQSGWDWTSSTRPPATPDDDDKFILWGINNYTIPAARLDSGFGGNSLCNGVKGFDGAANSSVRTDDGQHKYTLSPFGLYDPSNNPPLPGYPTNVEIPVDTTGAAPDAPKNQIQGPLGCKAGVMDQCVLILPIVDPWHIDDAPSPAPSPSPATLPEPYPIGTALRVRAWGAFWVTHDTSGAQENYYGQMIKYYPMQGNGWNLWSRDLDFTGPVVIHLIR